MNSLSFLFLVLVSFAIANQDNGCCKSSNFQFIDDPSLNAEFIKIRNDFISSRAVPFNRLDATILIPTNDPKVFHRASFGANSTAYPASVVKFPYMVAAMHWCVENGRSVECLDRHVRPMIVESDNVETGIIVDIITGAPNIDDITSKNDPRYAPWLAKRRYTQNLLIKFGFLGNQIVLSKTYPSNSGFPLSGAEKIQRDDTGGNVLQPCCMAMMMLEVIKGTILPEPRQKSIDYVKSLLFHKHFSGQAPFGYGMPVGTLIENKSGLAYDTLEDLSHLTLPNGKKIVLAAFSNGFQRSIDSGSLGTWAESVVSRLKLNQGGEWATTIFADRGQNMTFQGQWTRESSIKDRMGSFYLKSTRADSEVTYNIDIPEDGFYRIALHHPSDSCAFSSTSVQIKHAYAIDTITVNQRAFSRWSKLGDFQLKKGLQSIVKISGKGLSGSSCVVVDALKIERYTHCNGIPGHVCEK